MRFLVQSIQGLPRAGHVSMTLRDVAREVVVDGEEYHIDDEDGAVLVAQGEYGLKGPCIAIRIYE